LRPERGEAVLFCKDHANGRPRLKRRRCNLQERGISQKSGTRPSKGSEEGGKDSKEKRLLPRPEEEARYGVKGQEKSKTMQEELEKNIPELQKSEGRKILKIQKSRDGSGKRIHDLLGRGKRSADWSARAPRKPAHDIS